MGITAGTKWSGEVEIPLLPTWYVANAIYDQATFLRNDPWPCSSLNLQGCRYHFPSFQLPTSLLLRYLGYNKLCVKVVILK
jgi:hypothetical protein